MLSFDEMILLNNYYQHNITPLLVMEILGDLKKELSDDGEVKPEKVIELSTKLFPYNAVVNEHYRALIKAELMGNKIEADGRPILGNGKLKVSASGMQGHHFDPSLEEEGLLRWRQGNFLESDKILSGLWRNTTTDRERVENLKRQLDSRKEGKSIKNLDELNEAVEAILDAPDLQMNLLIACCQNNGFTPSESCYVLSVWNQGGKKLLAEFVPYTRHCLKADLFYVIGLQFGLMSMRPTDKVDLQYFYYLPFTDIFSSNDRIHKRIIPYFIRESQVFILGQELKSDLKSLVAYRGNASDAEKESTLREPPIITESLTYKLWNKFFGYSEHSLPDNKPQEWYLKKIKEFEKAQDMGVKDYKGEGDFVAKRSWMSADDPCFCGSGKSLKDCHLPKDYFEKNPPKLR